MKKLLPHLSVLDGHSLQRDSKNKHPKGKLSPIMEMVRKFDGSEDGKEHGKKRKSNRKDDGKTDSDMIEDKMEDQNVFTHDDIEEKPFFDLIMQQGDSTQPEDVKEKEKPMKDDSGVVSITNKKKHIRQEKASRNFKKGSPFFVSVEEVNIGVGGPSQWDN